MMAKPPAQHRPPPPPQRRRPRCSQHCARAGAALLLILLISVLAPQPCHGQAGGGRAAVGLGTRLKDAVTNRGRGSGGSRSRSRRKPSRDDATDAGESTRSTDGGDGGGGSSAPPSAFFSLERWEEATNQSGGGLILTTVLIGLVLGSLAEWTRVRQERKRAGTTTAHRSAGRAADEEDVFVEEDAHMDAAFGKVEVGFEDFTMVLKQKKSKEDRIILDGSIRGRARPGRMLAVMGPSGSGKSTFLHALAGKIKENKKVTLSGKRYFNGEELAGDSQLPAAFIEQEVNFFPHMTVKETLDFRVELKLGKKLNKTERDEVVNNLMDQLGLTKSAGTIVGNAKIRGLSGGERKRLSIACEMISSPPVIFLDEPTSGLDSYQATQVVETLRKLADSGKTVVSVIHQPSQHVFSMFDDLLLISEGKMMYYGEVDNVRSHLDKLGYGCAREVGTAEHVLECVSRVNGGGAEQQESHERIERLAEEAKAHASEIVLESSTEEAAVSTNDKKKKKTKKKHFSMVHRGGANIFRQFRLLMGRSLDEILRGKGAMIIKTVQQVSLGIIYGGIYQLGNNQASIQDRIGLLSLIVIGATNMATASTIRSFPKEKAIVSSELASNMYGTLPYFISKAISEIPMIGVFNAMFGSIIYPLTGLQKGKFKNFLGLTTLHTLASEAVGLLIGSVSPTSDFALALFPPIIVLNIIFDGKNISEENTPRFLRWITKAGLIRWGFEGLALNEFDGLTFETGGPRRGPVAKTGMEALDRFGLGTRSLEHIVRAQLNIVAACWFLSYIGLSLTKQRFEVMRDPTK